jgi:radical SAM protein (TIGR01212 family)
MNNPFPFSDTNRRFYTLDYFYRKKFGKKCFKVPLDGGFTCPNLDGTKGSDGCTYCGSKNHERGIKSIREQFGIMCTEMHRKWKDAYYIAYFNDFTNTYAPAEQLRSLYEEAISFDGVVGLNIATRADAIDDDAALLLFEIAGKTHLTVELGLQTIHDVTASRINRGHSYAEFLEVYEKLRGLHICVHIINGLPGEDKDMMLETARALASLRPQSVKLHLLHILRGTQMAYEFEHERFKLLTSDEYADIIVSQLELLPPETVIARISGDGKKDELIAPLWCRDKFMVMNTIDKEFIRRNSLQGKYYRL